VAREVRQCGPTGRDTVPPGPSAPQRGQSPTLLSSLPIFPDTAGRINAHRYSAVNSLGENWFGLPRDFGNGCTPACGTPRPVGSIRPQAQLGAPHTMRTPRPKVNAIRRGRSSRWVSGIQPSTCFAQVMSGWRTRGSSRARGRPRSRSSSFAAVPEHGQRLMLEGLAHERRHGRPSVGRMRGPQVLKMRALAPCRPPAGGGRPLSSPRLRLVVHATRADRVHVPPGALGLRMHERIAYTSLEETSTKRPLELGHPERVVRAVGADLEAEGRAGVVDRARERGEVVGGRPGLQRRNALTSTYKTAPNL